MMGTRLDYLIVAHTSSPNNVNVPTKDSYKVYRHFPSFFNTHRRPNFTTQQTIFQRPDFPSKTSAATKVIQRQPRHVYIESRDCQLHRHYRHYYCQSASSPRALRHTHLLNSESTLYVRSSSTNSSFPTHKHDTLDHTHGDSGCH